MQPEYGRALQSAAADADFGCAAGSVMCWSRALRVTMVRGLLFLLELSADEMGCYMASSGEDRRAARSVAISVDLGVDPLQNSALKENPSQTGYSAFMTDT